jgi:hypothetical protein
MISQPNALLRRSASIFYDYDCNMIDLECLKNDHPRKDNINIFNISVNIIIY